MDAIEIVFFLCCRYNKEKVPSVKTIRYFSDGAASQYKNYKNLDNLIHSHSDFGVHAEWHFFATSHGKSPCDGIGGTVKRLAARASLQSCTTHHILTPQELYQWAEKYINGIKFFFVPQSQVERQRRSQEARFSKAKKVPGIRSHHCFVPTCTGQLRMYRISSDTTGTLAQDAQDLPSIQQYMPGQYIAAVYDQKWYVGSIVEYDEENQDILVSFMLQVGSTTSFKWPRRVDKCWVPIGHVLTVLTMPSTTSTGRQYTFEERNIIEVEKAFKIFSDEHF